MQLFQFWIHTKENKTSTWQRHRHTMQQPPWKQPKCPSVDEWKETMWRIYAMAYYPLSFCRINEVSESREICLKEES